MANITVNKRDAWKASKNVCWLKSLRKHNLLATRLQPLTNDEKMRMMIEAVNISCGLHPMTLYIS